MKLLDHFHPPVSIRKQWEGCHSVWTTTIVQRLNGGVLPKQYESEPQVHRGPQIEVDVATMKDERSPSLFGSNGSVATAVETYAPPVPPITGEASFADVDVYEVQVIKTDGEMRLVAAIELVSESNKDRSSHRRSFATKCASYLQKGVSVVVIDVVTSRSANLHAELVSHMGLPELFKWTSATSLSAISYRAVQNASENDPARGNGQVRLDVWPFALVVGEELPTVPLWLAADLAVPLELELTYAAACKSLRLA